MATLLALAACGLLAAALAAPASAQARTPTVIEAQPFLLEFNDTNLQARVPLRPSAFLFTKTKPRRPIPGRFLLFFAGSTGLCAVKTNERGYAECPGPLRILHPTLNFGYRVEFRGDAVFGPSRDPGPVITLGSVSIG